MKMVSLAKYASTFIVAKNLSVGWSMCTNIRFKHSKHDENQIYDSPEWQRGKRMDSLHRYEKWIGRPDKTRWDFYDNIVWPPNHQENGEAKRGEVFFVRENVKHSPTKMWYACHLVRNMPIDEALTQLRFFGRKAAQVMTECLLEAQEKAVSENKIEYKSDMYVAEAFPMQCLILKGVRRHARCRYGIVRYRFCDVFIRLQEGKPQSQHARWLPNTPHNFIKEHIQNLRDRRLEYGL